LFSNLDTNQTTFTSYVSDEILPAELLQIHS